MAKQRIDLLQLLKDYCNKKGNKSFTLDEINETYGNYGIINIGGKTPEATVRRLLQELREEKMISFLDNAGSYTLGGENLDFLLEEEISDLKIIDLSKEPNRERKEYIREIYYRNTRIIKLAKERLGYLCLYPACDNTFLKEDNEPYIEVHHITPLCKDGTDTLENLSVVCAHHHRMAHFSSMANKVEMEKILKEETLHRI